MAEAQTTAVKYARATCNIVRFALPEELRNIETAGRACHGSGESASAKTAEQFARLVVRLGHESVLEHASATVEVRCPISVARQWMRHRLFSYTEQSLRHVRLAQECTFSDPELPGIAFGAEPVYLDDLNMPAEMAERHKVFKAACSAAHEAYCALLALGCSPEDARSVLPVAVETHFYATANLREWRHFFDLRCSAAAQHNIRTLARGLLKEFNKRAPGVFEDLAEKYWLL